jgi:hypothetical protein
VVVDVVGDQLLVVDRAGVGILRLLLGLGGRRVDLVGLLSNALIEGVSTFLARMGDARHLLDQVGFDSGKELAHERFIEPLFPTRISLTGAIRDGCRAGLDVV